MKPSKSSQRQKNPKNKLLMCSSYKGFGKFSVAVGTIFLAAGLIFGLNSTRIAVAAFFLLLGIVDLALYSKFGEG